MAIVGGGVMTRDEALKLLAVGDLEGNRILDSVERVGLVTFTDPIIDVIARTQVRPGALLDRDGQHTVELNEARAVTIIASLRNAGYEIVRKS